MKRLWIAMLLLAALMAGTLVNAHHVQALTTQLNVQLHRAQELTRMGDWTQAETLTCAAYDIWQDNHFYLHTCLKHGDTDEILRGFRGVLQYLDLEEMDQYAAANADLIAQIELLAEMEQAALVNVL